MPWKSERVKRDHLSNVRTAIVGSKRMVDAIECIVDNVRNIFVGNVAQQISLTIILETNVVYGLVKTKSVLQHN